MRDRSCDEAIGEEAEEEAAKEAVEEAEEEAVEEAGLVESGWGSVFRAVPKGRMSPCHRWFVEMALERDLLEVFGGLTVPVLYP